MAQLTYSEKLAIPAYLEACIRHREKREAAEAEHERDQTWTHIRAVMSGIYAGHIRTKNLVRQVALQQTG